MNKGKFIVHAGEVMSLSNGSGGYTHAVCCGALEPEQPGAGVSKSAQARSDRGGMPRGSANGETPLITNFGATQVC